MYCKVGDKPTVTYQFTGQAQKIFKSNFAPIDVVVAGAPIGSTSNYVKDGFGLQIYSTNNFFYVNYTILDYYIIDSGGALQFRYALWVRTCGSASFVSSVNVDPATTTINLNSKCPTAQREKPKTSIQVIYNGLVIFQDQAEGSVIFSVQCGRCPDGYCECSSPVYPGYCCLDCNQVLSEIAAITALAKSKGKQ